MTASPRTGRPKKLQLVVTEAQKLELVQIVKARKNVHLIFRARIVLKCAEGMSNRAVATGLRTTPFTVGFWRNRFIQGGGLAALWDEPRPGVPRQIGDKKVEEVVRSALETKPKGATHWSTRMMAQNLGLSQSTVSRTWRAFGLKPHRRESFQISNDPSFIEKVRDIVGLYMSTLVNALVLCVDEKSQIQALNRRQPSLPMRPGQVERQTPEYQRNPTTSLFAARDVATGNVLGQCFPAEFRKFLDYVDSQVPEDLDVHLIMDNHCTDKAAPIKRWLLHHPRYHLHFTPTHSYWLNQIARWLLSGRQIKRSSHHSVKELERAMDQFIQEQNHKPKMFQWTKTAKS